MDHVSIKTPEYVSLQFQTANLGSRSVAFIIDRVIIVLLQIIIGILGLLSIGGFEGLLGLSESAFIIIAIVVLIFFMINYGYFFLFEYFYNGQTPGKRLMGIRVIHESGHQVTLLMSLIRNLIRLIDSLGGYVVGILMVYFHPRNKRLGDLVAGTLVVHERASKRGRSKFNKLIQSRNLPLEHVSVDEHTIRSVTREEWMLLKTYADYLLDVSNKERIDLTNKLSFAILHRFGIDPSGKSNRDLEDILLTLYLLLKEEWDF